MRLRSAVISLGCLATTLISSLALGVEPRFVDEEEFGKLRAAVIDYDLAVPESPAFTALGITPEDVQRPSTPKEFATSFLAGLDKNGNFQTGLAVDANPYLLLAGDRLTLRDYWGGGSFEENPTLSWKRALARFSLSFATTKGTSSDDESVRLGAGVRWTIYDEGDPRLDKGFFDCLRDITIPEATDFETRQEWKYAVRQQAENGAELVDACHAQQEENARWNASAWDVAAAPTWIQKGGAPSDFSWGGAAFWSSYAHGWGKDKQLIGHVRYKLDDQQALSGGSGTFINQDSLLAGVRLRFGKRTFNVSVDASYVMENPDLGSTDHSFSGVVSTDIRLTDRLWVQLGVGGTAARALGNTVFFASTVKWGGRSFDLGKIAQEAGALGQ